MAYNSKFNLFLLFWTAISLVSGGCSKMEQIDWGFKGSESPAPATESAEERVYYTGSDHMPLYKNPGSSMIRRLDRHTKVVRDDLKRGYAHVRVDATGEEGWVENAKLIWRLPKHPNESEPAPSAKKTAGKPKGKELLSEEAPGPVESIEPSTPSSMPGDPAVAPSIFNPY